MKCVVERPSAFQFMRHMNKVTIAKGNTPSPTISEINETPNNYDMIVFCHLRWQFVYQRPQHIISRMAEDLKILMVEEPMPGDPNSNEPGNLMMISQNLHVLQPFCHDIASIADVLVKYVKNFSADIGWFYSAAFSPLLSTFKFGTVVYDCMDELALFKGASPQLIEQEKYLVASADIVFTGGKSLYESKKQMHENVYCFPSSVDEEHFSTALNGIAIPADVSDISTPVVGYFGVIDERLDLELLRETALKIPDITFVMIGPLAKIGEADLPQATNIRYTGMKSYAELPAYLKSFDIAMMPFALNDATKFISPTKTLEYMAAGKPIISTRITDVLRDYSDSVLFADDADEFARHINTILDNQDSLTRIAQYRDILDKTSWNATVSSMKNIIKEFAK